jgi:hypothetical protein
MPGRPTHRVHNLEPRAATDLGSARSLAKDVGAISHRLVWLRIPMGSRCHAAEFRAASSVDGFPTSRFGSLDLAGSRQGSRWRDQEGCGPFGSDRSHKRVPTAHGGLRRGPRGVRRPLADSSHRPSVETPRRRSGAGASTAELESGVTRRTVTNVAAAYPGCIFVSVRFPTRVSSKSHFAGAQFRPYETDLSVAHSWVAEGNVLLAPKRRFGDVRLCAAHRGKADIGQCLIAHRDS